MSVQLPTQNLANVTANQKLTIDLSTLNLSAAPVDPQYGPFGHLLCINDSGVTFKLAPTSQLQHETPVPSNRIVVVDIPPGEASMTLTVLAVYPYVYTPQCFFFYYLPYEPVKIHDLGAVSAGMVGNQVRTISIPIAVQPKNGIWSPTAAGQTVVLATLSAGALTTGQIITNYCYALMVSLYGSAAAVELDLAFEVQLLDHTSAVIAGPLVLTRGVLAAPINGGGVLPFFPTIATYQQFSGWPPGAGAPYQIQWLFNAVAVIGTPTVSITALADSDTKNLAATGAIGMFTPQAGSF